MRGLIKTFYRLFKYKAEWYKQFREIRIRRIQNNSIHSNYDTNEKSLVWFIGVGAEYLTGKEKISGGIISIISLSEETEKLKSVHKSSTIVSTKRNDHLINSYTQFNNKTTVFRFSQIPSFFKNLDELIVHVPELWSEEFFNYLTDNDWQWLRKINHLHINILNQNIKLMPQDKFIKELKLKVKYLTITTAHRKYCNRTYRNLYEVPLHQFSAWISPENYCFKKWEEKENLIVMSIDHHPLKSGIIEDIKRELPNYEVIIIQNLKYEEYKNIISKSKFSITFGEGLDGYFIEPVFSGCISFAVYNELFFTPDFKSISTIYESYEELKKELINKIRYLDNRSDFSVTNKELFQICASHYSFENYHNNIKKFYEKDYTFK